MDKFTLITFILCLLAAAVLLGFGITGLVAPNALSQQATKISEWVMVALGGVLLIFSIISLSMGTHLIDPREWFGAKKVHDTQGREISVVPPEKVDDAVKKFEEETGITVHDAQPASVFSETVSAKSSASKSPKKSKSKSSSKSSRRR